MNRKSARFRAVDVLLIAMMILPLVAGMALKILTTPASEGIEISGARIYFTIPMPVQDLPITESQVNSWLVMISMRLLDFFHAEGAVLKERSPSCGKGVIYDGSFSGALTEGDGVFAQLLRERGVPVYGESDIPDLLGKV